LSRIIKVTICFDLADRAGILAAMKRPTKRFEDRVRFNWGFWDGKSDGERKRRAMWAGKKHPDPTYEAGYWAGKKAAGENITSSADAWQAQRP
jgi:hypothetical protein